LALEGRQQGGTARYQALSDGSVLLVSASPFDSAQKHGFWGAQLASKCLWAGMKHVRESASGPDEVAQALLASRRRLATDWGDQVRAACRDATYESRSVRACALLVGVGGDLHAIGAGRATLLVFGANVDQSNADASVVAVLRLGLGEDTPLRLGTEEELWVKRITLPHEVVNAHPSSLRFALLTSTKRSAEAEVRSCAMVLPGVGHLIAGGKPGQDAAQCGSRGRAMCMALADGHGDAKYRRSDIGARLAVQVAMETLSRQADREEELRRIVDMEGGERDLAAGKLADALARDIHRRWLELVRDHAEAQARSGTPESSSRQREPLEVYGTTLLAALRWHGRARELSPVESVEVGARARTRSMLLAIRVGDGMGVYVGSKGADRIFEAQEKPTNNATASLAAEELELERRAIFDDVSFVLLCTDGLSDALQEEEDKARRENRASHWADVLGRRSVEQIRSRGFHSWSASMVATLGKASKDFTEDDASLVAAYWPRRFEDELVSWTERQASGSASWNEWCRSLVLQLCEIASNEDVAELSLSACQLDNFDNLKEQHGRSRSGTGAR
jgi:serine/threonine protein phosphatase PrpC